MSEIVVTHGSKVRELTIDELGEVSGGVSPLTLALNLAIARLLGSF
jgi:hypothetical protein